MKKLVAESLNEFNETLSGSEALYGFAAWLSSQDEKTVMSSKDNAAPITDLVDKFCKKQDLKETREHCEDELISMSENVNKDNIYDDVEGKIKRSKKLSNEIKEKIIPLIIKDGIHGTRYINGRVTRLKYPISLGCSLGADKNGFFVFTHRARSKSYPEIDKIPQKDIKFIKSTG
jgi:hypothetical protein